MKKQTNKQACETEAQKHEYVYKGTKIEAYYARKREIESEKLGLGFLGRSCTCMNELSCA